jgi:protein OS-9
VDLTVAQESARAANLELARGAGSRYLVQRWGDGEICDKTGKPREVEVQVQSTHMRVQRFLTFAQFHCSMTTTDTIILVREAKTCSYVLVVHTPRLCGEPGFKSRLESRDESYIQCREIVESIDSSINAENPLAGADRPSNKMSPRQPLLTVPSRPPTNLPAGDAGSGTGQAQQDYNERLRKMLEAVLGNKVDGEFIVEQFNIDPTGQEDLVFQVDLNDLTADEPTDEHTGRTGTYPSFLEALRAAGIEVKGEKTDDKNKEDKKGQKKPDGGQLQERDEL